MKPLEQTDPDSIHPPTTRKEQILSKLVSQLDDPLHQRIVEAYRKDNPVESMEKELGTVLMEILNHED